MLKPTLIFLLKTYYHDFVLKSEHLDGEISFEMFGWPAGLADFQFEM